jgi:hypothetical protein
MIFKINNTIYNLNKKSIFTFYQSEKKSIALTIEQNSILVEKEFKYEDFNVFLLDLKKHGFIIPEFRFNNSYFGFNYNPEIDFIFTESNRKDISKFYYLNKDILVYGDLKNIYKQIKTTINAENF